MLSFISLESTQHHSHRMLESWQRTMAHNIPWHLPLTSTDLEHNVTLPSTASGSRSQTLSSTPFSTVTLLTGGVLLISVETSPASGPLPSLYSSHSLDFVTPYSWGTQELEFPLTLLSSPLPYLPPGGYLTAHISSRLCFQCLHVDSWKLVTVGVFIPHDKQMLQLKASPHPRRASG